VDGGNGVQVWQYAGSWSQTGGAGPFAGGPAMPGLAITKDSSSVTITVPLSGLGLSVGNVILFDVYTSGGGGGDSAVDSLANPNQSISDWPGPYSSSRSVLFTVIPEPSTLVLVGLGALAVMGWMFRRRA